MVACILLFDMIATSVLALHSGLRYDEGTFDSGAQTNRPGQAGPVRFLLGGEELTGCSF
jgi:hypothetical protein